MPKVVVDSTVLVSAFLTKTGVSAELLRKAKGGAFDVWLAEEIIEETGRVLLEGRRIRERYQYPDESVREYLEGLMIVSHLVRDLPTMKVVLQDPADDMVVACAAKAEAEYIVTRDKDLFSLRQYKSVRIVSPEEFMRVLQ